MFFGSGLRRGQKIKTLTVLALATLALTVSPEGSPVEAGECLNIRRVLPSLADVIDAGRYIAQRAGGNLAGVITAQAISAHVEMVDVLSATLVAVDFSGDCLIRFAVDRTVAEHALGLDARLLSPPVGSAPGIGTDGRQVRLTIRMVNELLTQVVKIGGLVEARSLVVRPDAARLIGGE